MHRNPSRVLWPPVGGNNREHHHISFLKSHSVRSFGHEKISLTFAGPNNSDHSSIHVVAHRVQLAPADVRPVNKRLAGSSRLHLGSERERRLP